MRDIVLSLCSCSVHAPGAGGLQRRSSEKKRVFLEATRCFQSQPPRGWLTKMGAWAVFEMKGWRQAAQRLFWRSSASAPGRARDQTAVAALWLPCRRGVARKGGVNLTLTNGRTCGSPGSQPRGPLRRQLLFLGRLGSPLTEHLDGV